MANGWVEEAWKDSNVRRIFEQSRGDYKLLLLLPLLLLTTSSSTTTTTTTATSATNSDLVQAKFHYILAAICVFFKVSGEV